VKPLPPAPWTSEDFAILTAQWEGRDWQRPRLYPLAHSVHYDRRDYLVMLWSETDRITGIMPRWMRNELRGIVVP
jgi:hypothetical protein